MKDINTFINEQLIIESEDKFDESIFKNIKDILKTSISEGDYDWGDAITIVSFEWNKNITKIADKVLSYYKDNKDTINDTLNKELNDKNIKVSVKKIKQQATGGRWREDYYGNTWPELIISLVTDKCDYIKDKDLEGYRIAKCSIENGSRAARRAFTLTTVYGNEDNKQTIGKENLIKLIKVVEFILDKAK